MPEKPKMEKVTTSRVSKTKKSLGKKLGETFLSADFGTVVENCVTEVIIPAIKNLLYDTLIGGLEMSLWGEIKGGKDRRRDGPYISYTNYSKGKKQDTRPVRRATRNVDDIFFDSKTDAYNVFDNLCAAIERYGEVSVADLNDLTGVAGEFTDAKYGWTSLAQAEVKRYREGYLLVLPSVVSLED